MAKGMKMGGFYGRGGGSFDEPMLIYQISINEGTLKGAYITVTKTTSAGATEETIYFEDTKSQTVNIPTLPDTTYTAVLSDKAGYIETELVSYTTNKATPIYIVEGKYILNRAYITVDVKSADGKVPTGVNVTVGGETKAFEGSALKFTVEANTRYTISTTEWAGGTKPDNVTITTGKIESNTTVEMLYTQMPIKGKKFNDYNCKELKKIADAEAWGEYNFKVGDRHAVAIKGTVNGVNLTGTWYCQIIGFNHNWQKEGKGITLQFVNNSLTGGNNLAFMQYQMNTSNTNVGGWKNSIMRTKTCAEFFNALPKEWQDIIKTTTKYTDNQGGGNDNNPITATSDKIFLLAEKEVHGSRSYANSHEQNYQLQYDYYKAGNSKVKYNHTSTGSTVSWWVRSPNYNNSSYFCYVYYNGTPNNNYASNSYGFAPAFVI